MGVSSGVDSHFNPRLREGGDNVLLSITIKISYFNPRLREGGDAPCNIFQARLSAFQSTPPRRRRPICITDIERVFISIHASAKEATKILEKS